MKAIDTAVRTLIVASALVSGCADGDAPNTAPEGGAAQSGEDRGASETPAAETPASDGPRGAADMPADAPAADAPAADMPGDAPTDHPGDPADALPGDPADALPGGPADTDADAADTDGGADRSAGDRGGRRVAREFLGGAVRLDGDTLTIGNPSGGAALTLRGAWTIGRDSLSVEGDVTIATPLGDHTLSEASLTLNLDPFELVGSARVPFPSLGFLDGVVEGEAPFADIALAHGRTLGTIEINGNEMALDPDHYYFVFDYATGLDVRMGDASLSTPGSGSTLVLAPEEPMFYVGGDLAGMLTGGLVDDAAFGFSLAGRIPFTPSLELYDGEKWFSPVVEGHVYAQGTVQLGQFPVYAGGALMIDADADDDGTTIFEGDTRDVTLAGDTEISLGYSKAGFELGLEIARASWMFDGTEGDIGALYFHSNVGADLGDLFADTPLGFIETDGSEVDMYGVFRNVDDFFVHWQADVRVMGFDIAQATLELADDGVYFYGTLQTLPLIDDSVEIAGRFNADGTFDLLGDAQLAVGGFDLAEAHLRWNNAGMRVDGRVDLPGLGQAQLSGALNDNPHLSGSADLSPGGFRIAAAQVELNRHGARIAGNVALPGLGGINVSGDVRGNGRFELRGQGNLAVAGHALANANVTVNREGARIAANVGYAGTGFNVNGSARSDGHFDLTGRVGANAGIVAGEVVLSVSDRGVGARFAGRACAVVPIGEACHEECSDWGVFSWICDGWTTVCETVSEPRCMDTAGSVDTNGVACLDTPVGRQCIDVL